MTNSDLSIKLYFDLDNDRYRIEDETDYAGEGISTANVVGVYKYTDPNDNILYENTDFDNPDVDVDVSLYSDYDDFTAVDGEQTIVYSVYDSNTATTYTKTFTFTYDSDDTPEIVIGVEHNIGLATIESTDETAYTVTGATVTLNSRTHTLTWPDGTVNTETSTTVDSISLTELNTGEYTAAIESDITITQTDDLIIDVTIEGEEEHDVWDSDGMYAVRTALDTFYDRWIVAETDNPKKAREYAAKWAKISSNYAMYNSHKQNGDLENSGEYLNNIKTLLAAEGIDTDIDPSVSVPVSASLPGYANMWDSDSGEPADSLNRNNDYYLDDITGDYYKKEDGTYSKQGTLGTYVVYAVSGTIIVPTDKDGNNVDYTNASTDILVYRGGSDDTANWSFTKDSVSGADGTVESGILTITSITADTGYIDILCEKSGVDNIILRVYVKKVKSGQAIVDSTSVDDITVGLNASDKLEVKDAGVDTQHISDLAVTGGKLNFGSIKSNIFLNSEPTLSPGAYPVSLGFLDVDRIAAIYTNGSSYYVLACLEYSNGELAEVGTPRFIADVGTRIANLKKNRIVTLSPGSVGDKGIQVYDFDGTVFSTVGSPGVIASAYVNNIVSLSDTSVAVLSTDIIDGSPSNLILQKWNFNGSTWVQDGTDYVVDSSIYLSLALYGLDKSDDNTVFVHCYMTDKFYKCSFSGDWSTDFSATLSTSGDTEIVAISTNEFIIFADGNNKGWNYKIYRDELYLLGEITFPTVTGTGLSMVKMPDGMIIACLGATNGFKTYYYSKGGLYFE